MNETQPTATEHTAAANRRVLDELPFDDTRDFDDARRGFIATYDTFDATHGGHPVWNLSRFNFLDAETAPDTVNPSLWRIARLNLLNGLFQVTERIFQIRGFDNGCPARRCCHLHPQSRRPLRRGERCDLGRGR
jgi:alkyl sulfatase BDS1-like metallo-beta-lactamase superfamily hydrolase